MLPPKAKYRLNGGKRVLAGAVLMIDGRSLTMQQIAAELGVSINTARERHAKLKKLPGAVTMEAMRQCK